MVSQLFRLLDNRQHSRILRLSFPNNDGPETQFLVNALDATEHVSRDFELTVELLADDPCVPLKAMQGKLLTIELVRADGSLRYFSGHVFGFRHQRSDGGISFYEARLGPWFRFLALRKDNYLFHGLNLREQTASILGDYAHQAKWDWRVTGDDPPWTDACQFDETDYNYLSRRWEEAGYLYWYEHTATGHQLVVSDDSTLAPPIDGGGDVRFQRHGGVEEEDAIHQWSAARRVAPGAVALTGFDFKDPKGAEVTLPTLARQGAVPQIESYEYAGAYGFDNSQDGDRMVRLRLEEFEGSGKYYEADGNSRFCMPGRSLRLVDHFRHAGLQPGGQEENRFLILSVHHAATNNYLKADEPAHYRNRLTCTRRDVPWRPGRSFNSTATRILAPQTATVVGPSGPDSIHTDQFGRVRVQFHWDRAGHRDEHSSAWIRVACPWAGAELGSAAIPRVGSEVVVQWLDGNPDRPIITGSVHNARHMPPWELAAQQALTGLRSRELAPNGSNVPGGRGNHLVLDDTHAAIQAQLKSDHACSQLSLGRITRIEDVRGRQDARGEGWELATDAWGVARAGKGMLITTEARVNAAGAAKDMTETTARLDAAREAQVDLAGMAEQSGAQDKTARQADVAAALKAQNDGVKGAGAATAGNFPELSEPSLVLAGAAGIAMTSARSTHVASAEHTALTTGKDIAVAAGGKLFANIRESLRLFVQRAGMRLIAAAGDIDIKALSDSINVLAKLQITQTADKIIISARDEVQICGGGSYVKFSKAGIEHGTDGSFTAHAAAHSFVGARGMDAVQQAAFEQAIPRKYSQQLVVDAALWKLPDGVRTVRYKFLSEANTVLGAGTLDGQGQSARLFTEASQATVVELDVNEGKWEQIVTERADEISSPASGPELVFDYADHAEAPIVPSDDDPDDPDLSRYDITA
jgi:type VI secretion system secreted protein VgrG